VKSITATDFLMVVVVSLFIPEPVNIYITQNTFITYAGSYNSEQVGIIESIDVETSTVSVRRFLCWTELLTKLGDGWNGNISFWPIDPNTPVTYLCDTNYYERITTSAIKGIAFVFYYTDYILDQLQGLANVYSVTSTFNSNTCTISHIKNFCPFPSSYINSQLLSCYPSTLLRQILNIKEMIQRMMNTRSMSSRCSQSTVIHNINPLTWYYMLRVMGTSCRYQNVVIKRSYVKNDEFVLEKKRVPQAIVFLTFPLHLQMAQKVFGSGTGLGTRNVMSCSLRRRGLDAREVVYNQMNYTDTVNVIPFENENNTIESTRRGMELKYLSSEMELTVTVKYRKLHGRENLEDHFRDRNVVPNNNVLMDDSYPLHATTTVFGSRISSINLATQQALLNNGRSVSINEVCVEIDRML
jgi:hypothetical protein